MPGERESHLELRCRSRKSLVVIALNPRSAKKQYTVLSDSANDGYPITSPIFITTEKCLITPCYLIGSLTHGLAERYSFEACSAALETLACSILRSHPPIKFQLLNASTFQLFSRFINKFGERWGRGGREA